MNTFSSECPSRPSFWEIALSLHLKKILVCFSSKIVVGTVGRPLLRKDLILAARLVKLPLSWSYAKQLATYILGAGD